MTKDNESILVIETLRRMGFHAERIPESAQEGKRADIRAKKGEDSYLIEVKSRLDHPEFMLKVAKAPEFQVVEYKKELVRSNTLSGIIRKAVQQLEATPGEGEEFNCIWFRAVESLIPDATKLMEATLYGIRHLLVRIGKEFFSVRCYYFDVNEFFKYPKLHAVILNEGNKARLCCNSFAVKKEEFRQSLFYQYFNEHQAVTDPIELEKTNQIYLADTNIPRCEQRAIIKYLESKYGIRVNNVFTPNVLGGVITFFD